MRYETIDGEEYPIDEEYTTDKDGRVVSKDVTELMERLDNCPYRHKVVCHDATMERIGFWSKNKHLDESVFEVVSETDGWRVDYAKTRDMYGRPERGYCEIVREEI